MRLAVLALLLAACASQPPPRARPAAPPQAQPTAKKGDYSGPVWFDPEGKKVLRKSDEKMGKIAIEHKFAAEISVDGQRVATAPYTGEIALVAGPHRITIQEPGCAPRDLDITVPEGEQALPINTVGPCLPPGTVAVAPPPPPPPGLDPNQQLVYQQQSNTPAWIVTGVAGALVIAGGVFIGTHVAAAKRRDKLIEEDPNRFDARPVRKADNEAYVWSIASVSSFSGAAVALTTAIILFVTNSDEAPPDYNFGTGTAGGARTLTFDLGF